MPPASVVGLPHLTINRGPIVLVTDQASDFDPTSMAASGRWVAPAGYAAVARGREAA